MLEIIGAADLDDLFEQIPEALRLTEAPDLPPGLAEYDLIRHCEALAERNQHAGQLACFLGAGVYDHFVPAVVDAVISRGEFLTTYTPYQAEASQGVLQSIFEYQSLVCALTDMPVSNASLYDAASALGEAAIMAAAFTRRKRVVVSRAVHPHYREVLRTYVSGLEIEVAEAGFRNGQTDTVSLSKLLGDDCACLMVQYPNFLGCIEPLGPMVEAARSTGALLVVCADPVALGLLTPPGSFGADVVVGEGQGLGSPTAFGGPLLGIFACREQYLRLMPGRVVGQTVDTEGRTAYTLTLQAREQHIRRERATSNVCTNQALAALAATVYLAALGKNGLRQVAELCYHKAHYARDAIIRKPGRSAPWDAPFFKECVVRADEPIAEVNRRLLDAGMIGGLDLEPYYPELAGHMLLCVTEKRTKTEIDRLAEVM